RAGCAVLAIVAPLAGNGRAASEPPVLVAARRSGQIQIDGRLDDPASADAHPRGGFRQTQPHQGAAPHAARHFRALCDAAALCAAVRCGEPAAPPAVPAWRHHEVEARSLAVVHDAQLDLRPGYTCSVYAAGQQLDGLYYDDVQLPTDGDAPWEWAVAGRPG